MRTTIDIDETVLSAARAKARAEGISLGRAVSDLALQALTRALPEDDADSGEFPTLRGVPGHVVTDEMVAAYRDDD